MLYLFEMFTFGLRYFKILRTHTRKTRARALYVIACQQRRHVRSAMRLIQPKYTIHSRKSLFLR